MKNLLAVLALLITTSFSLQASVLSSENTSEVEKITINSLNTVYSKKFVFTPVNNTLETKLCTVAADQGYRAALKQGRDETVGVYCNGSKIEFFARRYSK